MLIRYQITTFLKSIPKDLSIWEVKSLSRMLAGFLRMAAFPAMATTAI